MGTLEERRTKTCDKGVRSRMQKHDHGLQDSRFEGRDSMEMDIDRMVNEGLAGGRINPGTGKIDEATVEEMTDKPSVPE